MVLQYFSIFGKIFRSWFKDGKSDNIRVVDRTDSEKNEDYGLDFENDLFSCVCFKTCCVSYIAMFMIYRNQK